MARRPRLVALGVFSHEGRMLVYEGVDRVSGERFQRPLGGGIEFGELAEAAFIREIREELGQEVTEIKLLGVLENCFTYEDRSRHEVLFVFDARFVDESLYEQAAIVGVEADGSRIDAKWRTMATDPTVLYPDGLAALVGVTPTPPLDQGLEEEATGTRPAD
jgi:ADP-ribose pyrophosphatase YjhB (NUDIX family)